MGDEETGKRHDASDHDTTHDMTHDTTNADDLERQAREAIARIRGRVGDLGSRVRRVIERAGAHWEASAAIPTTPQGGQVPVSAGERARTLARRWADIDFLVDPELAAGLTVHALEDGEIWRAEVRERGETRTLEERSEPYRGDHPAEAQPALPAWDYSFPLTPEIESGERRERVPGAGSIQACAPCSGTGHRTCAPCAGAGTEECPRCHGRGALTCPRCRGRGQIEASGGERPTLQDASHLQSHAERLLNQASERINFLRDRLRDEWRTASPAASLPGMPGAAMISCPDCDHGLVACDCQQGRRACAVCGGTGQAECAACKGSGRVVQHREVVRRFDTRIGQRTLSDDEAANAWMPADVLARGAAEPVWEGPLESVTVTPRPPAIPEATWHAALAFAALHRDAAPSEAPAPEGWADGAPRHVIARRLALVRLPLTRVAYTFAEKPYVFVAFGRQGAERFWAERFPHRWSRVGRFLRAISRDLGEGTPGDQPPPGHVSSLADYRAQRHNSGTLDVPQPVDQDPTGQPPDGNR